MLLLHVPGVTIPFAALVPPKPVKDGPLHKAIRMAPETHTTVPRTLRMPSFVKMLMASMLMKAGLTPKFEAMYVMGASQ